MGSSGQNINDIFKYMVESDSQTRIQAACNTLDWGHVAPTAPDTLGKCREGDVRSVMIVAVTLITILSTACYPLNDRDPFLIEEAPDVYFIGNQDHFDSQLYECADGHSILVVLIPRFCTTGQVILIQPNTLAVKKIQIGTVV
jgi:DNA polymerase delta subunit 2